MKRLLVLIIMLFALVGCSNVDDGNYTREPMKIVTENDVTAESIEMMESIHAVNDAVNEAVNEAVKEHAIYEGEESRMIKSVYTSSRIIGLTFSGLPEQTNIEQLLAELELRELKATFFITGEQAKANPDVVKLIATYGHEIGSLTNDQADLMLASYEELYASLLESKQALEQIISNQPVKYVRSAEAVYNALFTQAAAQLHYEAIIDSKLRMRDSDLDSIYRTAIDLRPQITRGNIIEIDLKYNNRIVEMLDLLLQATGEISYQLTPIAMLLEAELEQKAGEEIPGYELQPHQQFKDVNYKVMNHGNREHPVVALTFDDYGTDYTVTTILDILTEYHVPATFFLVGNSVERNPNLARAIVDAGFEVANHTYSHPDLTTLSDEKIQEEIIKTHHILTEAMQQAPLLLFRPPYVSYNDHTAKVVAATGYNVIAGLDVSTDDWDSNNDAKAIIRNGTKQLQNGSIVLLHLLDGIHTIEALPTLIEEIRAMGYSFVPMSSLLHN